MLAHHRMQSRLHLFRGRGAPFWGETDKEKIIKSVKKIQFGNSIRMQFS